MLHACKRFELHTFSSFREIKKTSLLPRITNQQLRHFRHQWGVRNVGFGHESVSTFFAEMLLLDHFCCRTPILASVKTHFFEHASWKEIL